MRSLPPFAAVALLSTVLSRGAGGQVVSPPEFVPGDDAQAPAAGDQTLPSIAAGGPGFLTAWIDARQAVAGTGVAPRVHAARLDAQGAPLGPSIEVSRGSSGASWVRCAWNEGAQAWLVVWNEARPAQFALTADVFAARVAADGTLLDPEPLVVDGADSIDENYPDVASDGVSWTVAWIDLDQALNRRVVDAARVDASGAVGPQLRLLTPSSNLVAPYYPLLEHASGVWLLAWFAWGSASDDVSARRYGPALTPLGGSFVVCNATGNQRWPEASSNGTDFFVVWQDNRLSYAQVFGTPVTNAGAVLVPNGAQIDPSFGNPYPAVGWDGGAWVVALDPYTTGTTDLKVALVSATGVASPATAIAPTGAFSARPAVAGGAQGACVAWADVRHSTFLGDPDVFAALVAPGGAVGAQAAVSTSAPAQTRPDFAAGVDGGRLVAFLSEVSGDARVLAARLDALGHPLDAQPIEVAGGDERFRNPAVAWNGAEYLFVWERFTAAFPGDAGEILGRRMLPDGTFLDPAPFFVLAGNDPDVAALGSQFLVVATNEATHHIRYVEAARVGGDGAVLDQPALQVSGNFAVQPAVEAFDDRWLVAWQQHPTHDNPQCAAMVRGVFAEGSFDGASRWVGSGASNGTERTPRIAIAGSEALVAWESNAGDVRARRLSANGTVVDGPGTFLVSDEPERQFAPAVAWDGVAWLAAWNDFRANAGVALGVGDVYGARVDAGLAVLDPAGFPIAADPVEPEANPALAGGDGRAIAATADYRDLPAYGSFRIALRRVGEPVGAPSCAGDGSLAPCPCANDGLAGRGCDNSAATGGAELVASGATASDSLELSSRGELASVTTVFLQGDASIAPVAFGDGLRCVGGALRRIATVQAQGGVASYPGAGDPSIGARSAALGDPLSAGSVRHYQAYYRDPDLAFCPAPAGSSWNVSQALTIVW